MYSSLKSQIMTNGLSHYFPSLVGLKQGCNLSPALFNIFINDLIENLPTFDSCPKLGSLSLNCLFYADDLVLIAKSREDLQKLIDSLYEYSNKWFLGVNIKKTKTLLFSKKRKKPTIECNFGNSILPICDSYCYLGTTFSQN